MKNLLLLILAFTLCFSCCSRYGKYLFGQKHIKMDKTVKIINLFGNPRADTITNLVAQALKIRKVTIILASLSQKEIDDGRYLGYADKEDDYYFIKLRPGMADSLLVETLIHEGTHLQQLESGRMKKLSFCFSYDDCLYSFYTPYMQRVWEIQAFINEVTYKKEVYDRLNGKSRGY